MTEKSYYWSGTAVGDATLAPYIPLTFHSNWKLLFTELDDEGYIDGYLNELLPTLAGQQIVVASGAAIANGWFYENTENVQFDIETPSANPRIDRIILRVNTIAQTVRLGKIVGTEAAAPTAPTLTQTNTIWEIPIAQAYITTAGVISASDDRKIARSPMMPQGAMAKIEEIESDGSANKFVFENIPQIYTHLFIVVSVRSADGPNVLNMRINDGDQIGGWQALLGDNAVISANTDNTAMEYNTGGIPGITSVANAYGQIEIYIGNYRSETYKYMISNNFSPRADALGSTELFERGGVIEEEDPITKITLYQVDDSDIFETGSIAILYGIV